MSDEPARILDSAADLLDDGGWCQHSAAKPMPGGRTAHCMLQAVGTVAAMSACGDDARHAAHMRLAAYIAVADPGAKARHAKAFRDAEHGIVGPLIAAWNDAPGRTREQALYMLRGAAAWTPPPGRLAAEREARDRIRAWKE